MIYLHYEAEDERVRALVSIARRCQGRSLPLMFLGTEVACENTRSAFHALDLPPPEIVFRAFERERSERPNEVRKQAVEVMCSALRTASSQEERTVVWLESPAPGGRAPPALEAFLSSPEARAASCTVISAARRADLSAWAPGGLLPACDAVISARVVLPRCPAWVIDPTDLSGDLEPGPARDAADSDLQLTTPLGQFVAGVAHELGNPLSIISSSLQYLHQRLATNHDTASEFTMTALANVDRMQELLRSMRDFAAVKTPSFGYADLGEIVSEVLRFTAAECARQGITVHLSADPSLPPAWVQPSGVKQIILNLVKNSLEAMTHGGHTLHVRTRLVKNGQTAIIEIANDGPAIPEDVLPRLFRPFYTTKDGGTGLGLYLSRQIAQEHGGRLEAENVVKGGVRFTLRLPVDLRREAAGGSYLDRRR